MCMCIYVHMLYFCMCYSVTSTPPKKLLDDVRPDMTPSRKASITQTFGVYLSASEAELMGAAGRYNTRTFWDVCERRSDDYADLADIAICLLVCITSEAEPERVFSIVRRILNRHRGRLHVNTIFYLVQIYLNGLAEEEKKKRFK